jgi:nicotinamidase-related amidase
MARERRAAALVTLLAIDGPDLTTRLQASALLTIDTQRDTLDGAPFEVAGTSDAAVTIGGLCASMRATGRPIIHIVRLYLADGSNAEPFRRQLVQDTALLRPGTPGRLLASALAEQELDDDLLLSGRAQEIGPREWALYKPRWGAFYSTPLEDLLRAEGVGTVVVAGCNFPNCPRATIVEASERDFDVIAVGDAISGLDDRGRKELAGLGVDVRSASELAAAL